MSVAPPPLSNRWRLLVQQIGAIRWRVIAQSSERHIGRSRLPQRELSLRKLLFEEVDADAHLGRLRRARR